MINEVSPDSGTVFNRATMWTNLKTVTLRGRSQSREATGYGIPSTGNVQGTSTRAVLAGGWWDRGLRE